MTLASVIVFRGINSVGQMRIFSTLEPYSNDPLKQIFINVFFDLIFVRRSVPTEFWECIEA